MTALDLPTSPCRWCGKPVVWMTTTTNAKGMPVDPEPSPRGNIIVTRVKGKLIARVVLKSEPRPANGTAFVAHFATCPKLNNERVMDAAPKREPQPEQLGLL